MFGILEQLFVIVRSSTLTFQLKHQPKSNYGNMLTYLHICVKTIIKNSFRKENLYESSHLQTTSVRRNIVSFKVMFIRQRRHYFRLHELSRTFLWMCSTPRTTSLCDVFFRKQNKTCASFHTSNFRVSNKARCFYFEDGRGRDREGSYPPIFASSFEFLDKIILILRRFAVSNSKTWF